MLSSHPYGAAFGPTLRCGVAGGGFRCVICRVEFEDGEKLKLLPCKHQYHGECIEQWLNINKVQRSAVARAVSSVSSQAPASLCAVFIPSAVSMPHTHAATVVGWID
jgi:hypothetical protein